MTSDIVIIDKPPPQKRRKISRKNKKKTIFDNMQDETECLKLVLLLDDILNNNNEDEDEDEDDDISQLTTRINNNNNNNHNITTIALALLKEICEYATGNYVKCKGECEGWIHFLHGDNFNVKCNNVSYAWNLFKYECDDVNCNRISHILTCNDENCCKIIQIREDESPYPSLICENALRLNPLCREMYCVEHCDKNGMLCKACSNYYCFSCEGSYGSHCATCDGYWCNDHREESTFFIGKNYYCDKCLSSGYCEENPYSILFVNDD